MKASGTQISERHAALRGMSVVLAMGSIGLLLLLASFALNAVRYSLFRDELKAVANQIAIYAAAGLPHPRSAYQLAQHAFTSLRTTPVGTLNRFPADLSMKVYLLQGSTDVEYTGTAVGVTLPLRAIKIELSATYRYQLLLDTGGTGGLGVLAARASASARNVPTDVVLVLENSNSLANALEEPELLSSLPAVQAAFGMWNSVLVGKSAAYGTISNPAPAAISKSMLRARQCFGRTGKQLKRAALELFDILSSSESLRVGVVLAQAAASGDQPLGAVQLSAQSSSKSYQRQVLDPTLALPDDTIDSVSLTETSGALDYEGTRCMALTSQWKIPPHPLATEIDPTFAASTFREQLTDYMRCAGISGACANNSHLAPLSFSSTQLLPRELLWIQNMGAAFEHGALMPRYDYVPWQFAILRALDMLRQAPMRADRLPVRRQVILVLGDGLEKSQESETGVRALWLDQSFARVPEQLDSGSGFSKQDFGFDPGALNPLMHDLFCAPATAPGKSENLIAALSSIDASDRSKNLTGIKLGLLLNGFRQALPEGDLSARLNQLAGHDPSLDFAAFGTSCNQKWGATRGRFLAEASARTYPGGDGRWLREQLVPQVARSLLSVELEQ